jgi:hypothetical protein
MARTTAVQIQAQATRLARALGYASAFVGGGSATNGVAWTLTLTTADTYADAWQPGADTHTITLARTARGTFDTLHAMADGAEMACAADSALTFRPDDIAEVEFILRSRGHSHVWDLLSTARTALEGQRRVTLHIV